MARWVSHVGNTIVNHPPVTIKKCFGWCYLSHFPKKWVRNLCHSVLFQDFGSYKLVLMFHPAHQIGCHIPPAPYWRPWDSHSPGMGREAPPRTLSPKEGHPQTAGGWGFPSHMDHTWSVESQNEKPCSAVGILIIWSISWDNWFVLKT